MQRPVERFSRVVEDAFGDLHEDITNEKRALAEAGERGDGSCARADEQVRLSRRATALPWLPVEGAPFSRGLMPRSLLATLVTLSFLVACGGPRPIASPRPDLDEEDEDHYIDEEEADDARRDGAFVDEAVLRERGEPLALGEPVEVPGTGVVMRPPEGAQPLPYGAGFVSMQHRVQISVVVAIGPESMLDQVRGDPAQREAHGRVEEVEIAGQDGRIGRDRVSTPQATLERAWLLVHDGTRGLAIVATYEGSRSSQVWPAIRESLTSVVWDREAEIDAARALGIDVADVDGLRPSRATSANLVLLGDGASFPPEPGEPVVSVAPLPMQLASEQSARVCEQILARLMPVPTSAIELEGIIDDGPLSGCERLATAEAEGRRIATYAALVFTQRTPILVTATVDAAELSRWRPRFTAVARAIHPRS